MFQWKLRLFTIMSDQGEVWQVKTNIQDKIRESNLDTGDIYVGNKNIINTALNPNSKPSTTSLDEVTYINQQHTSGKKKGKLEAYYDLWHELKILNKDYMKEYKELFSKVASNDAYNHTYIEYTEGN